MKVKGTCKHDDGLDDCCHCHYENLNPKEHPCKYCLHNRMECNFLPKLKDIKKV